MSHYPTFAQWLLKQTYRESPIGDLARDFKQDKRDHRIWGRVEYPTYSIPQTSDFRTWKIYLDGTAAKDALRDAFHEWIDAIAEGDFNG